MCVVLLLMAMSAFAEPVSYSIGDLGPAGGLLFYDKGCYSDGWRYLEAAPADQSTSIRWYDGNYITTGATATEIGSGKVSTATIVSLQGSGNYAASLCDSLLLGGYDDWFLPSKDELELMYANLQQAGLGGFSPAWYWSSSQGCGYSWLQNFGNGAQVNCSFRYNDGQVRALRAF